MKYFLILVVLLVGCDEQKQPSVHVYKPAVQATQDDDEPICGFACDVAIDNLNDD